MSENDPREEVFLYFFNSNVSYLYSSMQRKDKTRI